MNTSTLKITKVERVWKFPKERFFTYEPSDEDWCRPLGIGHEVDELVTTTIPNVHVTDVSLDGKRITFTSKDKSYTIPIKEAL